MPYFSVTARERRSGLRATLLILFAVLVAEIFPSPAVAQETHLTLAVVGDIMLSRTVDEAIRNGGWQGPFASVPDIIENADIAFANLESPVSFQGKPYPGKPLNVTFRANPGSLYGLKAAGFDVVSLANNHTNDYGPLALRETLASLEQLEIASCGAGASRKAAHTPAILSRGGFRFAFLAYADPIWSVVEAEDGSPDQAGVAVIREEDIIADIREAGKQADAVLVSLHWGEEYKTSPKGSDRDLARRLIDAGALAVLGHHPHVLQGAEWYNRGVILYSMGNFVFDMRDEATYDSAVAVITMKGFPRGTIPYKKDRAPLEIEHVTYQPIHLAKGTWGPGPLSAADRKRIINLLTARLGLVGSKSVVTKAGFIEVLKP